jgi:hypothetical protein
MRVDPLSIVENGEIPSRTLSDGGIEDLGARRIMSCDETRPGSQYSWEFGKNVCLQIVYGVGRRMSDYYLEVLVRLVGQTP